MSFGTHAPAPDHLRQLSRNPPRARYHGSPERTRSQSRVLGSLPVYWVRLTESNSRSVYAGFVLLLRQLTPIESVAGWPCASRHGRGRRFDPNQVHQVIQRAHRAAKAAVLLQGLISTTVPFGTNVHISSISSFVTAMQPRVQSWRTCAWPIHP